jgi:uncharacterized membrane protein YphA (DoxX/SURF4 family)
MIVGIVFLSEGIQKYIYPLALGPGRFEKIGIPNPEVIAYMVACFEIICGMMILLGFITRLSSIPLITIMIVAISTTKVSILINDGFWKMMHETRTDWSMLIGSIFLLIKGGGKWSIDRSISSNVK